MGTYQTSVTAFVRAWATQQARDAEITGAEYKARDVMEYIYCTAQEINGVYVSTRTRTGTRIVISQRQNLLLELELKLSSNSSHILSQNSKLRVFSPLILFLSSFHFSFYMLHT